MEFTESKVKERLKSLGYTFPDTSSNTDAVLVTYAMNRVSDYIRNDTNQSEIPDGLVSFAIDLACAEFFSDKMTFDKDSLTGLDLTRVVSQITEGDTTVSFASGYSDSDLLKAFVENMYSALDKQLACFRRIRW